MSEKMEVNQELKKLIPEMDFYTFNIHWDNEVRNLCHMGLVKGRNRVMRAGFKVCQNKSYYKKGNAYVHYNSISKNWILENN